MHLIRLALSAALVSAVITAAAQHGLEVIALRHRTAEQVLPALRPLLEPGGTLTGHGTQLIVRASPANLAELQRALEAIDRPSRRLLLSVRFDGVSDSSSRRLEAGGRISNRGSDITVRADESRASGVERVDQRLQVLEGGRAYIATGQSTPILDGSVVRETATGFEAVPRLSGDWAQIDISARRESNALGQGVVTTVSTRVGEWVEVGSAVEQSARSDRSLLASRERSAGEARRIWLKVEELPR